MRYHMFLDDERFPTDWLRQSAQCNVIIIRSVQSAIEFVKANGFPIHIYFDHDLGTESAAIDFAHFIINYDLDFDWWKEEHQFGWSVHSQNPIGANNIETLLRSYRDFKFNEQLELFST